MVNVVAIFLCNYVVFHVLCNIFFSKVGSQSIIVYLFSTLLMKYWNIPNQTWKINMMSMVYLILNIPMSIIGSFLMKKYGLRMCIIIVAVVNFFGGWIRCMGYKVRMHYSGTISYW